MVAIAVDCWFSHRQVPEHPLALMVELIGLAVHDTGGAHDLAAEGLADGLMAEAHAEDGQATGEMADHVQGDPGLVRRVRPRRQADPIGRKSLDAGQIDGIVAHGVDIFTEFAEILDEVVGERVVVVDHQQL